MHFTKKQENIPVQCVPPAWKPNMLGGGGGGGGGCGCWCGGGDGCGAGGSQINEFIGGKMLHINVLLI